MEVLDEASVNIDHSTVKYGGFWPRLGAMLLDGLVLSPITVSIIFFNVSSWKSIEILIIGTILTVAYKPFLEFYYGATLGKMAVGLKVVNLELQKASIEEILLRNIFYIVPSVISLYFSIEIYRDPGFADIDGFIEYSAFSQQFKIPQYVTWASALITLVDGIIMLADNQSRSLHDKIGKTLVIKRP